MSTFTAADVKRLRDLTGAGMMDCKKALQEAEGDFDKAIEVLRVKGAAKAAKRGAERSAANGVVTAKDGAMLELNCETDFVAKNDQFIELADQLVALARETNAAGADELRTAKLPDGKTADEAIEALAAVIGEKLALGRVVVFEGTTATYLHRKDPQLPPQVGVLVEYTGEGSGAEAAAKSTAQQVAAMSPQYVSRDQVPAEIVEQERRIAEETARNEGKPEPALPKIVEGRLNGFFKDTVLLDQESVHEKSLTVGKALDAAGVTVSRFARFAVGQD